MPSAGRAISFRTLVTAVVALLVIAIAVSAAGARPAAAPLVTLTIWLIGVAAYTTTARPSEGLAGRRSGRWALASAAGLLSYFGLDLLAAALATAGMLAAGLATGFAANVIGVGVASFVGKQLVQRSSRSSALPPHGNNTGRPSAQSPFERTQTSAELPRARREALWVVGAVAGFAGFVVVVMAAGIALRWPRGLEWLQGVAIAYALLAAVRLAVWVFSGEAWRFRHWPDVGIVFGVCLLAYGALGVIDEYGDDSDRYLATLGAGLSAGSAIARRRTDTERRHVAPR